MSHNTFHFVSPRTPANGQHWVDRSKALSHSARIAHKRRKQNALAATKTSPSESSRTSAGELSDEGDSIKVESPDKKSTVRSLSFDSGSDDDSELRALKEETRDPGLVPYVAKTDFEDVSSMTVKLPKMFSKSTLDPFFRAATPLSVPDEHVLHLYLSTIPHQIYGTTTGNESSIIQNQTMAVMATNTIGVLWLLMTIEANVTSFHPTELERYRALLSKRTRVLRLMAEKLKDPKSSCRDDFVLATAIAAGCERRLGNVEEARRHLQATKRILNLRGGLHTVRSMPFTLGLMVVNIFVEQSMVNFFESMSILTNKITWLREALQAWQTHNLELRNSAAFSGEQIRYTYRLNRAAAFSDSTALRKFVQSIVEAAGNGHERSSLGFLFAMNHTFWAFRKNDDIAMVYLDKLIDAVKRSASANFVLQAGDLELPSMLLLLKIAQSSVQSHQWNDETRAVLQIEQVFEFVNLLEMASAHSRTMVISALSSWLISSTLDAKETVILSDTTLDCLRKEIIGTWYKEQKIEGSPKLVEID